MSLLCIRIVDKIDFYAMVPQISTVHLTKISNWLLFKLIISDQALITFELSLLRYVRFDGKKFTDLPEKLSLNPRFFLLKMQKYAFLKKNGVSKVSNLISVGNKRV